MFDISPYHLILVATGGAIVLAYWLPRFVSGREPAASALLIGFGFLAFGWIPGLPTSVSPIVSPAAWGTVSGICIVAGLFGVGLRIDRIGPLKKWKPTIRLLVIAMPISIAGVAIAGWLGGMTVAGAVLLGALLAPTDPVLASDVQVGLPTEGGEHPVRFALTTEAALNDGLALPFVYLALAVSAAGSFSDHLLFEWLWRDVAYRIVIGAMSGVAVGWVLGKILFDWPAKNALADTRSGIVALAGIFLAYGLTEIIEGYGFIAVFIAAVTLRRVEHEHDFHTELHDFIESIERALTAILLVGLGASLPALLPALEWSDALIGVVLILVIRPLSGWLSLAGTMPRSRQRAVVAFYGIRGVGSINYLAYASVHLNMINVEQLWAIVAFTVLLSTVVHGFTAGIAVERATGGPDSLDDDVLNR